MGFEIDTSKMGVLLIVRDLNACELRHIEKIDVYAFLMYADVIRRHGQQAGHFWVVTVRNRLRFNNLRCRPCRGTILTQRHHSGCILWTQIRVVWNKRRWNGVFSPTSRGSFYHLLIQGQGYGAEKENGFCGVLYYTTG